MRVKAASRKSLILIRQMIDNFINTLHAPIQLIPRNRSLSVLARARNNLRFKRALRVFFTLQSISDNLSRGRGRFLTGVPFSSPLTSRLSTRRRVCDLQRR